MRYIKDFTCFDNFSDNYANFSTLKSITVYDDVTGETKMYKGEDENYWTSYIIDEIKDVFGYYPESNLVIRLSDKEFELYNLLIFLTKDIAGSKSTLSVVREVPYLFYLDDSENPAGSSLARFLIKAFCDVKLIEVLTKHPYLYEVKGDILTVFSDFELRFKVTDVHKFNTLLSKLIMLGV